MTVGRWGHDERCAGQPANLLQLCLERYLLIIYSYSKSWNVR